jgi:TonB family protein
MRLAIFSSLVLLPVLAHGQANTSAVTRPVPASAVIQAELTKPAGLPAVVKSAVLAEPATAISSMNVTGASTVREFVQTRVTEDFAHLALRQAGTLETGFKGSEVTAESAPNMTRPVEVQLTQQELAAAPDLTQVAVSGTVDAYGYLRNPTVTRSAGKAVDKKALAAVSESRFKPATVNNQPVDAAVTISIQIEKQ